MRSIMADNLTITGLVDTAYNTAEANGWHEEPHPTVVPQAPKTQIAALAPFVLAVAQMVEAIRKPRGYLPARGHEFTDAFQKIEDHMHNLQCLGLEHMAMIEASGEAGNTPMLGSKTQVKAHLMLMVTELAEAIEAVEKGDAANFREELADLMIRVGDTVGWLNQVGWTNPVPVTPHRPGGGDPPQKRAQPGPRLPARRQASIEPVRQAGGPP